MADLRSRLQKFRDSIPISVAFGDSASDAAQKALDKDALRKKRNKERKKKKSAPLKKRKVK